MRIVLAFLLPFACVLALTQAIERMDSPVAAGGERGDAVAWADRVFTSRAQLADWLEARGTSYESWVARHPGLSPWEPAPPAVDGPDDRVAAGEGSGQSASASTSRPERAAASVSTDDDGGGFTLPLTVPFNPGAVLLALAALLGMGLIAVSALPPMLYAGRATAAELLIDRRAQVGAAGLSLLVGVGIPALMS
jgi:hypothetical protein